VTRGRQIYLQAEEIEQLAVFCDDEIMRSTEEIRQLRDHLKWAVVSAKTREHSGGIGGVFPDTEVEREEKLDNVRRYVVWIREDQQRRRDMQALKAKLYY
jgi:hypothetical protein